MKTSSPAKLMPKYEQVALLVEQQIDEGRFGPGDRIYSIRQICEEFGVGDVTAKTALRRLSDRGLVRTVAGSGAFVTDPEADPPPTPAPTAKATDSRTVGFIKTGLGASATYALGIDLMQQELQRAGFSVLTAVVEEDDAAAADDAIGRLRGRGVGPLIVFPSHKRGGGCVGKRLCESWDGPCLILESRPESGDYVTADLARATEFLVYHLYDLGHRRLCLATNFERKVQGFERAVARLEGVRPSVIGESGKSDAASHSLAEQVLAQRPRPTGVIVADDHAAAVCIAHFRQAGLHVPRDISVAAYNDHPTESRAAAVPVTMAAHPVREVAQEVARWVERQVLGTADGPFRREITGPLIVRDSTGPAGSEATR